tara:strand:+ start:814 stop:1122 length:309 start_codon:yes stop_codon:yes gene_type:complete
MTLSLLKFSSEDCGTCHRMSHYDLKVSQELGCEFIDIKLQDTLTYRKYRHILLSQYPDKKGMGWPTYLLVSNIDTENKVIGELKGGMSKGEFRENLSGIIPS